jgi:hypothetical protein
VRRAAGTGRGAWGVWRGVCGVGCVAWGVWRGWWWREETRGAAHVELKQLEAPRDLRSIEPRDLAPDQALHQHRGVLQHRVGRLPSATAAPGHGACGLRGDDA